MDQLESICKNIQELAAGEEIQKLANSNSTLKTILDHVNNFEAAVHGVASQAGSDKAEEIERAVEQVARRLGRVIDRQVLETSGLQSDLNRVQMSYDSLYEYSRDQGVMLAAKAHVEVAQAQTMVTLNRIIRRMEITQQEMSYCENQINTIINTMANENQGLRSGNTRLNNTIKTMGDHKQQLAVENAALKAADDARRFAEGVRNAAENARTAQPAETHDTAYDAHNAANDANDPAETDDASETHDSAHETDDYDGRHDSPRAPYVAPNVPMMNRPSQLTEQAIIDNLTGYANPDANSEHDAMSESIMGEYQDFDDIEEGYHPDVLEPSRYYLHQYYAQVWQGNSRYFETDQVPSLAHSSGSDSSFASDSSIPTERDVGDDDHGAWMEGGHDEDDFNDV